MNRHTHTKTTINWVIGARFLPGRIVNGLIKGHVRRKAERERLKRLKLGDHLLQDIGFNPQGYPLPPMAATISMLQTERKGK